IWRDPQADGSAPNDWTSIFSGPAWEYVPERGQYYLHLFSKKQPDLNWDEPKVRAEVHDLMRFWLDKGVDGFRMDVINLISKQFGDAPGDDQYFMGPRLHEFLQAMNREVLAGRDLLTVGECPGATPEDAVAFSAPERHELSMIFTFEHMDLDSGPGGKWDLKPLELADLKATLAKWQHELHGRGWNSLYLNNHDQPRMVSRFGDDGLYRVESAKMLANIVHFMEGTPYIYQGEELGMTNLNIDGPEDLRDLESINAWHELVGKGVCTEDAMLQAVRAKGRDNARSPMQWDDTDFAGFSTQTPWLKVNANYPQINAKAALADPDSVFHYYRKILSLRRELPVMVYGSFQPLFADDPQLFAWERSLGEERLIVINNFSAETVKVDLSAIAGREEFALFLSNYKDFCLSDSGSYELRPYEAFVLYNEAREMEEA
ncbi:MAG TPA: alpha-amylase family glycosyl hydrolase, partial [Thioalkalivibrio sp.]|nr:alpha-amylase family glycosyl hydrolase [Thioalkalivibrio sp.]